MRREVPPWAGAIRAIPGAPRAGIYLSEDGGEHWSFVQQGPAAHSRRYEHNLAFAPSSADASGALTWYAALTSEADEAGHDAAGLYRSDDRGRTWQRRAS